MPVIVWAQPDGIPPLGTACSAANSRAVDPRIISPTAAQLLPANLVRSFVPGTGDPLNGIVVPTDPAAFKGFDTRGLLTSNRA